jgi:hypothetical protein
MRDYRNLTSKYAMRNQRLIKFILVFFWEGVWDVNIIELQFTSCSKHNVISYLKDPNVNVTTVKIGQR